MNMSKGSKLNLSRGEVLRQLCERNKNNFAVEYAAEFKIHVCVCLWSVR